MKMMKQNEVNFEIKTYLSKEEYEKDGCPVFYFEFDEHDCYGLIAIKLNADELDNVQGDLIEVGAYKAAELYVEVIAGESPEEILEEGFPVQITKSEALLKYLLAPDVLDKPVGELIKEFEEVENGVLLIDGSLV